MMMTDENKIILFQNEKWLKKKRETINNQAAAYRDANNRHNPVIGRRHQWRRRRYQFNLWRGGGGVSVAAASRGCRRRHHLA